MEKNVFAQPIKDNKITHESIRKIATDQGDNYTTGCLLDYPYFKDSYKIITVDLNKQQILGANPKANQQINFTAILDRGDEDAYTRIYFIFEEARETRLFTRNCKSIVNML